MPDIFLSYSREDQAVARRYAEAFQAEGFDVWWDVTLRSGEAYDQVTEKALREAKAVVVLWSKTSVDSRWVRAEATQAQRNKTLLPAMIEACDRPIMFELTQTAELSHWQGDKQDKTWRGLVADVRRFVDAKQDSKKKEANTLSICVLPFSNMSGDVEQEYFSDGITEDVITDLSKVSALFVIARNTAFSFKGKSFDIIEIAKKLKVSHILEGSVRKSGGRVRITAQLIDGTSGGHVWAERYDRDLSDIFALQDEISHAIVKALKLKLLPEEKKAIEQRGTTNLDAYNLYLMARQYIVTGNLGDARRSEAIIRLCRHAIELDPNYARAWALIAIAQVHLRFYASGKGETGLEAAERALSLDENLAEAHAAKASVLTFQADHDAALKEIDKALALDPESYDAHIAASRFYYSLRKFDDAIRHLEKSAELQDRDYWAPGMLISCYLALGNTDALRRAASLTLARTEKIVSQDPNNGSAMGFQVIALGLLGERERAKQWATRAALLDPDNNNLRYNIGCSLASTVNDPDGALEILGPLFKRIPRDLFNWSKSDPDLDSVRSDPRYLAMQAEAEARLAKEEAGKTDA